MSEYTPLEQLIDEFDTEFENRDSDYITVEDTEEYESIDKIFNRYAD